MRTVLSQADDRDGDCEGRRGVLSREDQAVGRMGGRTLLVPRRFGSMEAVRKAAPRQITLRPAETPDEAGSKWIGRNEHDQNRRSCRFGCRGGSTRRSQRGDRLVDQFSCEGW